MASHRHATETSPLLGQHRNGSTDGHIESAPVDGDWATDSADGSEDLERRSSVDELRAAQFRGVPEIRQTLKYILPALSIGVGGRVSTRNGHL